VEGAMGDITIDRAASEPMAGLRTWIAVGAR
jgi:hypothetical protein